MRPLQISLSPVGAAPSPRLNGLLIFWVRVSPSRARYFSLRRQRKVPKRNAGPTACPLTRVPCASRYFERSPDSQHLPRLRLANTARQGGSLALKIPAMLGCANGNGVPPPVPSHSPSTAANPETGAHPGLARNAGDRVPFSLGTFSWAHKRKYLALQGEKCF